MKDPRDNAIKILVGVMIGVAVCFAVFAALIIMKKPTTKDGNTTKTKKVKEETSTDETGEEGKGEGGKVDKDEVNSDPVYAQGRPSLLSEKVTLYNPQVEAVTAPYVVAPDFSNVDNRDLYRFTDEEMQKLVNDYFYVSGYGSYEFFEIYESNRYDYQSSFVTVDSLMHTYHLYFVHLLKGLEKGALSDAVERMSLSLLEESNSQFEQLKGTEWEDAARRNVIFFAVGAALQDDGVDYINDDEVYKAVNSEVDKIIAANGIDTCAITDSEEDYSQYKPRGYYDGDPVLERYFRTMMWYGRIHFNATKDDMVKSSILMTAALNNAGTEEWKNVYDVTTFFAGASDDLGFYEYNELLSDIYGENPSVNDFVDDEQSFTKFKKEAAKLRLPEINSIPINMGEENLIPGFRLMGQRFSIDASIFQQLIYQNVKENSKKQFRMLPDVLDVPAAFGSDVALELLEEQGDTEYAGYMDNMNSLREKLSTTSTDMALRSSLSGMWIDTLRPLFLEKGEGYPSFMQSKEWAKRDLECFAGSYTELKHDTVLYSKQSMAEMGGGGDEIPVYDDRGYVQPEPVVFAKFTYLAEATRTGLQERKLISQDDSDNLKKLEDIARTLTTISEKELRDEVLTDAEYDFIREYGGNLEHFWYDLMRADSGEDYINLEEHKAALVTDVATDPNGSVLELGTGNPLTIYVMVNVDGKVKVARGVVYDFYQFEWPLSDRLTDSSWRQKMGIDPQDSGYYEQVDPIAEHAWWTDSYKVDPRSWYY